MGEPAGSASGGRLPFAGPPGDALPTIAPRYRGRFAPSPTGALHFGSLIAAVGSYLDARAAGGEWLLRIEDVDTPRNVPGADAEILRTLEAFGLTWDGEVVWQSRRLGYYRDALGRLIADGWAYPCACSRREIEQAGAVRAVDGGSVYPGTCRAGLAPGRAPRAWRLRVPEAPVGFVDRVQGQVVHRLAHEVGDFVLQRADGPFAYQLAVVVDDGLQGVTDVVRGADLLESTPRQIWLQRCLGLATPRYLHLPVATNAAGEKWSKQTRAPALDPAAPTASIARALSFLGQSLPVDAARLPVDTLLAWAVAHWQPSAIPRSRAVAATG